MHVKKTIVFQPVVPQYRLGFFQALDKRLNGQLEVCATQANQKGFDIYGVDSCGFQLRNIQTLSGRILGKTIFVQPYVLRALLRRNVDVIITMNQMTRPEIWIVLMLKRVFRKKVVLWGHGFVPRDSSKINWLRKQLISMADAAIFYSYSAKERAELMGLPAAKLFIAPNALDTERIELEKSKVDRVSLGTFAECKNVAGRKIILYVGRILKYKKPDVLVRSMPEVLGKVPDAGV